jgi:hypothetical protein
MGSLHQKEVKINERSVCVCAGRETIMQNLFMRSLSPTQLEMHALAASRAWLGLELGLGSGATQLFAVFRT